MTLLILSGESHSGKTEMANHLNSYHDFDTYALGDAVKDLTYRVLKICNIDIPSKKALDDPSTKEHYRKYLQQLGTECCREVFGERIWSKTLNQNIEWYHERICISDARFMDEIEYFEDVAREQHCQVITVRIRRPSINNDPLTSKHRSETEFRRFEPQFIIDNDSDLEAFHVKIDEFVKNHIPELTNDYSDTEPFAEPLMKKPSMPTPTAKLMIANPTSNAIPIVNVPKTPPEDTIIDKSLPDITLMPLMPPLTISSRDRGVVGEEMMRNMISEVRPDMEIIQTSSTGHLADFHGVDHKNNIKYVFEVKLKKSLTMNDVTKFKADLKNIRTGAVEHVIGVFLSIDSNMIPSIGNFSFENDEIYLGSEYINKQILEIIFSMYSLKFNIERESVNIVNTGPSKEYTLSQELTTLLIQLRIECSNVVAERDVLMNMKTNAEGTISGIYEMLNKLVIREHLLGLINGVTGEVLPGTVSVTETETNRLKEYIKSVGPKAVVKKDLLTKFPLLKSQLGALTKPQIISSYGS